ncbi:MAG: molybdopterin-dependent oxidoreductase, partial [Chloroflexota bacterium]|nr:molybdopterin-dependent oxidoreductase [Chloroflexota bacterium]
MVLSSMIGAQVKRKEDPRLITGSSTYVDDIKLPGILIAAVVRSPYPHARITKVDTLPALAISGVVAALTGEELAAFCGPLAGGGGEGGSGEQGDREEGAPEKIPTPETWAIAREIVRFVGEAVAVVVATSAAVAEDAVDAVVVEYDQLPNIATPKAGERPDAQLVYENVKGNIGSRWNRTEGDIEAAFRDAPVVAKARIRSQRLAGVPMEPRGVLATPDPVTQGLTVWTSTQAPHWNRNDIAEALGLSQNQVRAIAPEVGGGFGVKIGAYQEDFIVAALAHKLKRPVKWIETRSENFLVTHHGR